MTKRGVAVLIGAVAVLLTGCARPAPGPHPAAIPTTGLASCVDVSATPARGGSRAPGTRAATSAPRPTGSADGPGEQFERNRAANNMFRQRHPLPPAYLAAGQRCVVTVRAGLERLRGENRYDPASVRQVLQDAGLHQVEARPPGRLDRGYGDGVVFAGESGVGCVFGQHAPEATSVDLGSLVADGGCLVAAD